MANEKRLIDANEARRRIVAFATGLNSVVLSVDTVMMLLTQIPTVAAVEVVHGRWVPLEYDGYADGNPVWDLWECSECHEEHSGDEDTLTNYCPNCGAKMDA